MDTSKDIAKTTRGTLRLTMSRGANVVAVALMLAQFQSENPGTTLDILWIVREGFHAGIRLGDVLEQDMIAVQISEPLVPGSSPRPAVLPGEGGRDAQRTCWTIAAFDTGSRARERYGHGG